MQIEDIRVSKHDITVIPKSGMARVFVSEEGVNIRYAFIETLREMREAAAENGIGADLRRVAEHA
jgi:hypothetical protein